MTITTLDGAIAGTKPLTFFMKSTTPTLVAGKAHSTWITTGIPGAGTNTATLGGVTLSSTGGMVQGQIPFTDPGSGLTYLARFVGDASQAGKLLLCDRLWHNGGFTSTTANQTINSPAWPARDANGATAGVGVYLAMEYNTTGAANIPVISYNYTSSAGAGSHSANNLFAVTSGGLAGSFHTLGILGGDLGVQSVQNVSFSIAPTAGSVNLVAYRVIAALEIPGPYQAAAIDLVTGGMSPMYNGSVPFLVFIPSTTTATMVSGALTVTQG